MLRVQEWEQAAGWAAELEELLVRIGHRFGRVDLRRRMRAYVHGLLGPVGRKNGWQLAEYAGLDGPAGLQHLLNRARWDADAVRDDLQGYVAERLGQADGVLILDATGLPRKGTTSAGVGRQSPPSAARRGVPPPAPPAGPRISRRGYPRPARRVRRLRLP